MSLTSRPTGPLSSRARFVLLGALVLAIAVAVGVLVSRSPAKPDPRFESRSVIQGPQPDPAQVRLPDGRSLTCPRGAKPAVVVEGFDVQPALAGGTRFLQGSYRVAVRASVVNETNHPIRVSDFRVVLAGRPWRAQVSGPTQLPADTKSPLSIRGVFHSRSRQVASAVTDFSWHWREHELGRCGARGLIEDD